MASLTEHDANYIAKEKRSIGRLKLANCLKWPMFDEEDDLRRSILLDYLYDTLMFVTSKGLPWKQVCFALELAKEMQEETLDKPITEAIQIYKEKVVKYSQWISSENLKVFTNYFFVTFMQHYKLYQYVFRQNQNQQITKTTVAIETPPLVPPFSESKCYDLWEYEKKYNDLEMEEKIRLEEIENFKSSVKNKDHYILKSTHEKLENAELPLEREVLSKMIEDIAGTHISAAAHSINAEIQLTMEDIKYKLEKTSLPRPQVLGPPPRYQTKSPIHIKKPKSPTGRKSAKPSRASSRTKKL